jgi:UDP-N-acetylmuramate dehydrogenase
VELLTKKGELITVDKSYFNFDYNYSKIQETGDIVLRAVFKLQMKTKDEVWGVANASGEYRKKSQPQGVFSAGCTFRNISLKEALTIPTPEHTTSAGYLLDKAGMKGYSIGGVSVSTQHANFIINSGNATAEEMVQLIAVCKDKVREKFHVSLVEEVKLIGHFIH